jgi:hypothetical protein
MANHRETVISAIGALAIASIVVLLFASAFGNPFQHPTRDEGTLSTEPSASSPAHDLDLRLVAEAVDSLRRIHTDSMDYAIPPAARPLLTVLKHRLCDLISDLLRVEGSEASPQQLQAKVIVDLRRSSVIVTEPACVIVDQNYVDKGYDYGDIYDITVKRPQYCFDLIAVTTTIGVCCGTDTSLYVFKYEDREWKLILASEANDYDLVSGAQGTFQFGASWPDESGRFFVVTTSVNPWCSSNWQAITYRVLRPGPAPFEPRVLLSHTQSIWLGDEPPYRLEVGDDWFTLSFHDERYLELLNNGDEVRLDDPKGKRIIRYSVDGDSVRIRD